MRAHWLRRPAPVRPWVRARGHFSARLDHTMIGRKGLGGVTVVAAISWSHQDLRVHPQLVCVSYVYNVKGTAQADARQPRLQFFLWQLLFPHWLAGHPEL